MRIIKEKSAILNTVVPPVTLHAIKAPLQQERQLHYSSKRTCPTFENGALTICRAAGNQLEIKSPSFCKDYHLTALLSQSKLCKETLPCVEQLW